MAAEISNQLNSLIVSKAGEHCTHNYYEKSN